MRPDGLALFGVTHRFEFLAARFQKVQCAAGAVILPPLQR